MSEIDVKASRFGHVALLGRPNVGKSTLLNALIGADLSIVSPKPQTTRHRILGIATHEHAQIAFLDTPGLHEGGKRAMNRQLNRVARHAPDEADILLHVIAAPRWTDEDEQVWKLIAQRDIPRLLVINKIDLVKDKTQLLPFIDKVSRKHDFAAILLVGARKEQGTEEACKRLVSLLPEREALYDADTLTDRSERHLAGELVREQLMRQLGEEVPYACAVEVEAFTIEGHMRRIVATIWVERDGQKAIVIGEGGERLKHIGTQARMEMEKLFDGRVHLELWVKVRPDWSDNERVLKQLGFD